MFCRLDELGLEVTGQRLEPDREDAVSDRSATGLSRGDRRRNEKPTVLRGIVTRSTAVLAEGRRVLINDPRRLHGVRVIGVDEHVWRHTRHGDRYVTVIIDLTGIRDGTGAARLLDMVEGRSKQALITWLAAREQAWREG